MHEDDTEVLDTQSEEIDSESSNQSMDDTIRQTLADIEARDGAETQEEKVDRRRLRERGQDGKYLPKQDAAPQDSPQGDSPAPSHPPEGAAPNQGVPPELQRLGLRKEEAEAIAANPVAMQAIIRRSEEMHRGLEQYRERAQFGEVMSQAIAPFAATIQAMGIHPAQAVQKLLVADHSLRNGTPEQKQQMLMKIAQDYGVQIGDEQMQPMDPAYSSLQTQLQQLQGWVLQRHQQEQLREAQALNSEIGQFASDPANNYFEHVRLDMAGLLQAGLANDLKDAYEKAIYANPQIRAQLLAQQQAAAAEERNRKVQDARRAASVNVARRGNLPPARPVGSMEDTIKDEAKRLGLF